jgi:hypothetical protein
LLFDRTLAAIAEISVNRLARRSGNAPEWTCVEKRLQKLAEAPLDVHSRCYPTVDPW